MDSSNDYLRREGFEIGFYIILGIIVVAILPIFIGYGLKGFEEFFVPGKTLEFGNIATNYLFYLPFLLGSLFLPTTISVLSLLLIRKGEHPATQENPTWWRIFTVSVIHDPEKGLIYTLLRKFNLSERKSFGRWSVSIIRFMAVGIIFFGFIGAFSLINPGLSFTGTPNIVLQQVTPATEVIFTAEPASFAETGTLLGILAILLGINSLICARFRLGIGAYYTFALFICFLMGFLWLGIHNIVYGNNDTARLATFFFGFIGSLLTVLFGTFILWYVWHFSNNIFSKIGEIAPGNTDVVFYSFLILSLFTISYLGIEIYLFYRRKKKRSDGFVEPKF